MIRLEVVLNKKAGVPVVVSPDLPGLQMSCIGLNDLWTEAQHYAQRVADRVNSKKDSE